MIYLNVHHPAGVRMIDSLLYKKEAQLVEVIDEAFARKGGPVEYESFIYD
jgi:hypothetical protein